MRKVIHPIYDKHFPSNHIQDIPMIYKELAILLPCHSLEDFPTHHTGDDAASLLASWTGLWHPLLIANSGSIIKWHRADDPPETLLDILLVVTTVSTDN